TLQDEGVNVLMVDTNQENVKESRLAGLNAVRFNIVSEAVVEELNLAGIGRLLAVTPNDESNSLAAFEFSHRFGRRNIFQLSTEDKPDKLERDRMSQEFQARYPFEGMPSFAHMHTLYERGFVFKKTRVSDQFNETEFRKLYGEEAVVMFMIEADGETLHFIMPSRPCEWKEGQKILALVPPIETAAAD
ncbi:NAD-binding protein, partial [bacterium]|nr:NAD-binding protein [bacterium]